MQGLIFNVGDGDSDAVGRLVHTTSIDAIRAAHLEQRRLWVEIGARSDEGVALLLETFGLHPLVVEDIFTDRSSPKIDPYPDYLYIVVHALRPTSDPTRLELVVLDIVVGKTFVLTQHRDGHPPDRMRARLEGAPQLLARGSAWVAHAFLDAIVDPFLPRIEALVARVDDAELHVLGRTGEEENLLPELVKLRRAVRAIDRMSHHQRKLLCRLAETELPLIPDDVRPYFRDVHEHFSRVAEEADRCMDVMADVIEAHLSVQSNRMNATVKRLTVMSTVMLPLNLIASFYGMNFVHTPEFGWFHGRAAVLALMAVVTGAVWTYFQRKRWV